MSTVMKSILKTIGFMLFIALCINFPIHCTVVNATDNAKLTYHGQIAIVKPEIEEQGGFEFVIKTTENGCPGILVIAHSVDLSDGDYIVFEAMARAKTHVAIIGHIYKKTSRRWYLDNYHAPEYKIHFPQQAAMD